MLAWIQGAEPARARVESALEEQRVVMSWINLGEVAYVLERGVGREVADDAVREIRARAVLELPDAARVLQAARVKARNRMAYADAFACATSAAHGAVLLTGDPEILAAREPGTRVEDLR